MKLSKLSVRNFRSLKSIDLDFGDYTCLVGANGTGKSSVLKALNLFFCGKPDGPNSLSGVTEEDFYQRNVADPIQVELTFTNLSQEAKRDFSHYVRSDELRVVAEIKFDPMGGSFELSQHGFRLAKREFVIFFEKVKEGARVDDLRTIYQQLRKDFPDLPSASTKVAMQSALEAYVSANPDECEVVRSSDKFYGVSRGVDKLEKYVQWVFVPAVKDAVQEGAESKSTAIGDLLQRTVRAQLSFDDDIEELRARARDGYREILKSRQPELEEISRRLDSRMKIWANPQASLRLSWTEDRDRSIRIGDPFAEAVAMEGSFVGGLGNFGHGFQRSFLLAVLQELVNVNELGPRLLFACEEPEIYQHPPQARYMASVLRDLAEENCQVFIATHSPTFVPAANPEAVKMCRIDRVKSESSISATSVEAISDESARAYGFVKPASAVGISAKIHAALQSSISELFFAERVVLVEGQEDRAFLEAYLQLLGIENDFRQVGGHIVVCFGKSAIARPLIICRKLQIPVAAIFDADGDEPDKNGSRSKNERENLAILRCSESGDSDPFPAEPVYYDSVMIWPSNMSKVVKSEIGSACWTKVGDKCRNRFGNIGGLSKNPLFVAEVLSETFQMNRRSQSLEDLCNWICRTN